jgi:hypothetical protein
MFVQVQAQAVAERVLELCIQVVDRDHRLQAEVVVDARICDRDRCVLTKSLHKKVPKIFIKAYRSKLTSRIDDNPV